MIRVLVVDDQPVRREGVATVLGIEPDVAVVANAGTGDEGFRLAGENRIDVAVVDMRLPVTSGITLCSALRSLQPSVSTVMMTTQARETALVSMLRAGAMGLILKSSDPEELRTAIRIVSTGGTYFDPALPSAILTFLNAGKRRVRRPHGLSKQQLRVVSLLPLGMSNRQIGVRLGVSEHTVRSHVQGAMQKLGKHRREELAAFAVTEGLV